MCHKKDHVKFFQRETGSRGSDKGGGGKSSSLAVAGNNPETSKGCMENFGVL